MKRFLYLSICCIVVFSVVVSTAFAADSGLIDYNDYVIDVAVNGSKDIVTCRFPVSNSTWALYNFGSNVANFVGDSVYYYMPANTQINFNVYPLAGSRLDASYIPKGTVINFGFSYEVTPYDAAYCTFQAAFGLYVDGQCKEYLYSPILSYSMSGYQTFVSSITLDSNVNFDSFDIIGIFSHPSLSVPSALNLKLDYLELVFSIDSLIRLQELTGKSNKLLEDITNYKPEVDTPAGGDVVGDVGDIESGLIEDVSGGLDELGSTMEGTLAVLGKYANSLFAVAWIMGKLFDISEFNDLISVSLGLSVIVLLFNVSLTVSSSIARRSRSSGSKSSGKGGGKK